MNREIGIGLDLGGTSIKYALATSSGQILKSGHLLSDADADSGQILDNLSDVITEMLNEANGLGVDVRVIGIGTPGNVNIDTGFLMGSTPNFKHWRDINIIESLERRFPIPVFADNDANVMAIGEARLGAGKGYRNLICVTVGTGIGGGFIVNGQLYRGSAFAGGEFGHSLVQADGLECNCGSNGCLEVYASATAMIREYKAFGEGINQKPDDVQINVARLFELYGQGDPAAKKAIDTAIYYLGRGLAASINIFNPEIIVIGGGVADAGDKFIADVRKTAFKYAMRIPRQNVKIVAASLGNKAGFLGAILFAFEQLAIKEKNPV
jgi:glucokinase